MDGTVRWYSAKGFGFIDPVYGDAVGAYYFHITSVDGRVILQQGQKVSFTPTTSPKGLRAVDVRVVETKDTADDNSQ